MTPSQHYEKADALMVRVDEMENAALPVSVALTQQAQVYALLALFPERYPDDPYFSPPPMVTRRAKRGML